MPNEKQGPIIFLMNGKVFHQCSTHVFLGHLVMTLSALAGYESLEMNRTELPKG